MQNLAKLVRRYSPCDDEHKCDHYESTDGEWVKFKDIASTLEEFGYLQEIATQAKLTLLCSIQAPEQLGASFGKLNLICREHFEWFTTKIPKAE